MPRTAVGTGLRTAWYWLREFFGENAYARYVADWQARHAGMPPTGEHRLLTEREFFSNWIEQRYGSASGRC
jgi:uncharacterized short protein YbdD (DUF466 family)